jgi:hypothetical protein
MLESFVHGRVQHSSPESWGPTLEQTDRSLAELRVGRPATLSGPACGLMFRAQVMFKVLDDLALRQQWSIVLSSVSSQREYPTTSESVQSRLLRAKLD